MLLREMIGELRGFLDAGIAVEVSSAPGVGKSEAVQQFIKDQQKLDNLRWGVSTVFLATQTPVDMLGYLIPGHREYTGRDGTLKKERVSEFTRPIWTMSDEGLPIEEYDRFVILFDERDKADSDTSKTCAEIELNASLGPWRFDKMKVGRISLCNRAQDRSGSGKKFDFLINRHAEIGVTADLIGWKDWALAKAIDPLFVTFADKHPEMVFTNEVPKEQGPFCTPRSLVNLSKVLPKRVTPDGRMKTDSLANEIASGMIGTSVTMHLMSWIKLRTETPDWDDIMKDPAGIAIPAKPDCQLMVCYEAAHKVDVKTAAKCITFIKRLPAQFAVTFCKAAVKRNYDLVNTPAFMDWVAKNSSLLQALGGAK